MSFDVGDRIYYIGYSGRLYFGVVIGVSLNEYEVNWNSFDTTHTVVSIDFAERNYKKSIQMEDNLFII